MDDFQDVIRAIETLGKKYYFNDTAKSIQTFQVPNSKIAIVTSHRAIRDYDSYHPERIRCILLTDNKDYYVVVKNRDVDINASIRFWLNKKPLKDLCKSDDFKCDVCFQKLVKPGKQIYFNVCSTCACTLCIKCLEKIQLSATSHKCPVCQTWVLDGEGYGVPYDQLDLTFPSDYQDFSLEKQLIILFEKLDGLTNIIMRQDSNIYANQQLSFCRLSYTNRYSKTYDTSSQVARLVVKIYIAMKKKNPKSLIKMYILRDTYKNDKNESSAFKITNNKLVQYDPDAWINIFESSEKVAYMKPLKPVLPEPYIGLYQEFQKYSCEKTISIIHELAHKLKRVRKIVANFDTDVKTAQITLHQEVVTAVVSDSWECNPSKIYVTCRLFPYENKNNADFMVFIWDSNNALAGFVKVDSQKSHEIFNDDIDELKKSKIIKKFL